MTNGDSRKQGGDLPANYEAPKAKAPSSGGGGACRSGCKTAGGACGVGNGQAGDGRPSGEACHAGHQTGGGACVQGPQTFQAPPGGEPEKTA
jgi:hypothetical protein